MQQASKPRILCVDDEPMVLEGLTLHLRRRFDVVTADGGPTALKLLGGDKSFAVILSDMRMPGMSGAELLAQARALLPDTVRILLTGHADFDAALAAVNQGQIYRFLTKPCPPQVLIEAISSGAEHHRLVTAERELLEQTLVGSIKALTEVLALSSPVAFGRAVRLKRYVSGICDLLHIRERWSIEAAAQLSQVGCISLPPLVAEKLYYGRSLSEHEQAMVDRLPAVVDQLLGHIARLEPVREILAAQAQCAKAASGGPPLSAAQLDAMPMGARLLQLAMDFDKLEASGVSGPEAVHVLEQRPGAHPAKLLEALRELVGGEDSTRAVREVLLPALRPGMVFAEDVRSKNGRLLVGRGYTVTQGLIERMQNMEASMVPQTLRVFVDAAPAK